MRKNVKIFFLSLVIVFVLFNINFSPEGKIVVVYAQKDFFFGIQKKQGLFSDFQSVLGAIEFAKINKAAGVRVQFETDIYLDWKHGDNYFAYYFKPIIVLDETAKDPQEVHYNKILATYGYFGSFTPFLFGRPPKEKPFPLTQKKPLTEIQGLVRDHIQVQPEVAIQVDDLHKELIGDCYAVGVHFRGTDKKLIWPYISPNYDSITKYVDKAIQTYGQSYSCHKIYVATDETEFYEHMMQKYPNQIAAYSGTPRLSKLDTEATDGGTHKSTKFSTYQKGLSAVIDMLMLSKCNYLVKNRSSLSDVALEFNPALSDRYTFILNDTLIYSQDF